MIDSTPPEQADQTTPPGRADLAAMAQAADLELSAASAPPGQAAAEPAQTIDQAAEVSAMLSLAVGMLAPAMPFLPQCYTPEVCTQIGTAAAAVAEKRGWNLSLISSPELALAAVAIPPTIAAVQLGREHFARLAQQRDQAQRQAQQRTGARAADIPPQAAQLAEGGRILPAS